MTEGQWRAFCSFKDEYKNLCKKWSSYGDELVDLEKAAIREKKDTPDYPMEIPVVYNRAYDELAQNDDIHMLVIGDNPGKDEQRKENSRYLVGQSGKLAEGFFKTHPELESDFRKNVIILNKTPVHTAKTSHLKFLYANGSDEIKKLITESQKKAAELTASLHQALVKNAVPGAFVPELWIVGYAELKKNGVFAQYRDVLKKRYMEKESLCWNEVYVFQHFSMNRFSIDLKNFMAESPSLGVREALKELGRFHRDEIL